MSERLPYEEQLASQWDDLSLPDENLAWADMKRRLEEDDDKPLLPFWLRGCAGWALLGLLLLGLGWWILRPEKWFTKTSEPVKQVKTEEAAPQNREQAGPASLPGDSGMLKKINTTAAYPETGPAPTAEKNITAATNKEPGNQQPVNNTKDAGSFHSGQTAGSRIAKKKNTDAGTSTKPVSVHQNENLVTQTRQGAKLKRNNKKENGNDQKDKDNELAKDKNIPLPGAAGQPVNSGFSPAPGNLQTVNNAVPPVASPGTVDKSTVKTNLPVKDTTALIIKKDNTPVDKNEKKDSSKNHPLEWSAGIGLQQQLPVAGQKWSPYNAQGRKNSLSDFIPSVYLRLTRPEKWFIQAEFRYGAPQNTKDFVYRQSKVSDTGSAPRFYYQTSSSLKKTYYHQLPLVFNYYIRPGWSLGAGIQWNNFYRAISEQEVLFHSNILGNDTVLSKVIKPEKRDTSSEFKKSFFQGVAETQYKWKRFSFGARYTFGLQPYIEFQLPGGVAQNEKMNSLQLFIRFELWRQKTKK